MTRRGAKAVVVRPTKREIDAVADRMNALMERGSKCHNSGRIKEAVEAYRKAGQLAPWYAPAHYDLGLVYKYARRWRECLAANLRALEVSPDEEGAIWNAGIAATALGDWKTARAMWKRRGIEIPGRSGETAGRMGSIVVRLNPEGNAETVWAMRICPCRAMLMSVPLADSGYRCGDMVLHDGAPQGTRRSENREVPVFNVLQRLVRSRWRTYSAEIEAESANEVDALEEAANARRIRMEDWTGSVVGLCLRCSYGVPHKHAKRRKRVAKQAWDPLRSIGIAAASRADAQGILNQWAGEKPGRKMHALFAEPKRRAPVRPRHAWWNYEEFAKDHG